MEFQDIRLRERFTKQSFKLRKLRIIVGGIPNNLTQSARGCRLRGLRAGGAWGALSFDSFLLAFPPCPDDFAIRAGS